MLLIPGSDNVKTIEARLIRKLEFLMIIDLRSLNLPICMTTRKNQFGVTYSGANQIFIEPCSNTDFYPH